MCIYICYYTPVTNDGQVPGENNPKQTMWRELKVRLGKKTFVRRKHWVNEGRRLKNGEGGREKTYG